MSTLSAPFGLEADYHPSGIIRPDRYSILSGYTSGILQNQPVKIGTNGQIQAAAIADRIIGTFQGCEYTDANGIRQYANQWTASTTGTDLVAIVSRDPNIMYRIQANATLTIANIGEQYAFTTVTAGNTTTGLSALMLDVSSTAANAAIQIVGLTPGPDNAWGDAFPIVNVRISQHQFVADVAAF